MSSKKPSWLQSTAAWRISIWPTVAFAIGTVIAFGIVYVLVAREIQSRSDAWLSGEAGTLAEVSANTPRDALSGRIVEEVAELASHEVTARVEEPGEQQRQRPGVVFFMQVAPGQKPLWVGPEPRDAFADAINKAHLTEGIPESINVAGWNKPFRVVYQPVGTRGRVYLGFYDEAAILVMHRLTNRFVLIGGGMVLFGFLISSFGAYRTLRRVETITETVAHIGSEDLSSRLKEGEHPDEISRLASTFNRMLDRIQESVHQLRIVTDSVAHDMKSPVTSIRGRLEFALASADKDHWQESVAEAIEGLDRLSEMLNTTLDLAEADAGALQLRREPADLAALVQVMVDLYQPAMADRRHHLSVDLAPGIVVEADVSLLNRALANLFENELSHLPPGRNISIKTASNEDDEATITIADDGPGFSPDIRSRAFERFVKGQHSTGRGLGLAFVNAIARAHRGRVEIAETHGTGAAITVTLPLAAIKVS